MKEKALDKQQKKNNNPYKGLHSYEEEDKVKFYGRDDETGKLLQLVKFNFLTVLYGKAGIGKTSLLNAGLFPLLRDEGCLPIRVRLNYTREAAPLMEQIHKAILKEIDHFKIQLKTRNTEEITETEPLAPGETLWEYFHRVSHFDKPGIEQVTPVLVLDQFEEFFTIGKKYDQEDKDNLIDELYWLIENQLPPSFKEKILKSNKKENISAFKIQPEVRLIISLREDYLPHFTGLKKQIVSIDRTMFRVIHLNAKQAREIIQMPGGFKDKKLKDKILLFFYPEDAKEKEKTTIPDEKLEKLEIEPTFLSLLCHQLFEEHKKQKLKSITTEDQSKILEAFYDSVIKDKFPDKEKADKVKEFIESKLLTEGGYRTPYYLEANHPLKESIDNLVEGRIIRKFQEGKKEYIEIIHDVLEPIIKEKRNKRLDEKRKQEYKKQLERKRKYYKRKASIIYSISIILVCLTWFAFHQTCRLREQYRISQAHKLTAEALLELPHDNIKAIRIAEAAYEKGLPNPPPRTCQALSEIGYSFFEEPFYTATLNHKGTIYTAVFSPDDKRILTAHEDGTVKMWDLKGTIPKDLAKHKARVLSAVFSPDGNRILTASWDHTVKLWDRKGKLLSEFNKHNKGVFSAVFSPDGNLIVTASMDRTAKVFNVKGDVQANLKHNSAVSSAVFSPDGKHILTASWDKSTKLWNINGENILDLNKHDGQVYSARFSPDGSRILTASEDGTAKMWDLEGNLLLSLNEHQGDVFSAVFSPDGNRILTASDDSTAKVWDLSGNLLANLNKHKSGVKTAFFASDANWIITASKDGTAKLWDYRSNILTDLNKHRAKVNTAVFSPNGRLILTASMDSTVKLWNLEGQVLFESNIEEAVLTAEFSPDGRHILTASGDYAKVWMIQAETKETRFKFELERNLEHKAVSSAAFSPDGSLILTASENGFVKLWNRGGNLQATLNNDKRLVSSAVFSPNGDLILTTSRDARATLWNLDGKIKSGLIQKGSLISAVFSPDGSHILTASADGTARVLSLKGEALLELIHIHNGPISSAVFSPDGRRILTASEDDTAKLWNLKGKLLAVLNKHKGGVLSAMFSPDGRRILTASIDGTAKVWLTPGSIYQWLDTAKIPELPKED
ncbi:MAG: hypothetical protein PVH61_21735 [Candidatus Aminicenantes bacterium]|jgi:WD40 repeat protein